MGSAVVGGPVPERKAKAAEVVARRIAEDIFEGGLGAGDPLPNEAAMLRDLGVGRPTLREALRLLETQGVLRIRPGPGGGPVVRRPDPGDLAGAMTLLLQSLGATLEEAFTAWAALEPVAAALAASAATAEQVAGLESQVRRMRESIGNADFYAENFAFHALLAEAAGNTVVLVVLDSLARVTAEIGRSIRLPRPFRSEQVRHADGLVAAVAAGDAGAATAAASAMLGDWQEFSDSRYPGLLAAPIRWSPGG